MKLVGEGGAGRGHKHSIQNNYLAEEGVALSRVNLARESALTWRSY